MFYASSRWPGILGCGNVVLDSTHSDSIPPIAVVAFHYKDSYGLTAIRTVKMFSNKFAYEQRLSHCSNVIEY